MGGAVKPVVKAVGDVGGAIGIMKKTGLAPSVAEAKAMLDEKAGPKASRMDEEQGARMRGARRRGRQLLSDARLNPEAGMQETLGGGNNLG